MEIYGDPFEISINITLPIVCVCLLFPGKKKYNRLMQLFFFFILILFLFLFHNYITLRGHVTLALAVTPECAGSPAKWLSIFRYFISSIT